MGQPASEDGTSLLLHVWHTLFMELLLLHKWHTLVMKLLLHWQGRGLCGLRLAQLLHLYLQELCALALPESIWLRRAQVEQRFRECGVTARA